MAEARVTASRREQVADAALRVLGESGSRGLTHRAVDTAAKVPPGTTSNYFNSRSSLLEAALALHVELDTPPEVETLDLELTDEEALNLMVAVITRLLDTGNLSMLKARYELMLESSRNKDLHETFEPAREHFVRIAETVLAARGCDTPREHGAQLVVVMDGVLTDSLIGASSQLDLDAVRDLLARQLETC